MKFTDNYYTFMRFKSNYLNKVANNDVYSYLEDVVPVFNSVCNELESYYNSIYDFILTDNTNKNIMLNYGLIKEDSVEAINLKNGLKKNINLDSSYFKSVCNIADFDENNTSLIFGDRYFNIEFFKNGISVSHQLLGDNIVKKTECFESEYKDKPTIIINQELPNKHTKYVVDYITREILWLEHNYDNTKLTLINFLGNQYMRSGTKMGKLEKPIAFYRDFSHFKKLNNVKPEKINELAEARILEYSKYFDSVIGKQPKAAQK